MLDLADLTFVDVIGVHALEDYARTLNGFAPLVLDNVSPRTRRLFEIVGADGHSQLELGGGDGRG